VPGKPRILKKSLLKLVETSEGVYVEYAGLVTSESKPGVRYHTTVGLLFRRDRQDRQGRRVVKVELTMWSCDCDAGTFYLLCKHAKALVNSVLKEARSTVKSVPAGGRESGQRASVSA